MNKPAPSQHIPFEKWDLDLLVDYILKFHHRNTRKYGAEIYNLLLDVDNRHHELDKVTDHFRNSIQDLDTHCMKEEQVLFPIYHESLRGRRAKPTDYAFPLRHN